MITITIPKWMAVMLVLSTVWMAFPSGILATLDLAKYFAN